MGDKINLIFRTNRNVHFDVNTEVEKTTECLIVHEDMFSLYQIHSELQNKYVNKENMLNNYIEWRVVQVPVYKGWTLLFASKNKSIITPYLLLSNLYYMHTQTVAGRVCVTSVYVYVL